MKKYALLAGLLICFLFIACRKNTQNRYDPNQDYEHFINAHVFAACEAYTKPYARYSLATLLQRPGNDRPFYKVRFINGPCKGLTVRTQYVITKTHPIDDASLIPTGTVVIRNFDNPTKQDKDITSHWNLAVVMGTDRAKKGIIDLGFPRDKNDFFPARESIYIHNVRTISKPTVKDIRQFIN